MPCRLNNENHFSNVVYNYLKTFKIKQIRIRFGFFDMDIGRTNED